MSRRTKFQFSATFPSTVISPVFVKVKAFPMLENEHWTPLITTFMYDSAHETPEDKQLNEQLFAVLAQFYQTGANIFERTDFTPDQLGAAVGPMLGEGSLKLLMPSPPSCPNCDHPLPYTIGLGGSRTWKPIDEWKLIGLWPHSINFGELCYSSSTEVEIEVTWRYKVAEHIPHPYPGREITQDCSHSSDTASSSDTSTS